MEEVYAVGVSFIEGLQHWFKDFDGYFELVNEIASPNHMTEWLFPLISVLDSVFGAQLILSMAFGGWLNTIMKWWFLEDRPYWWVRETSYYTDDTRPKLRQTTQTCETGPGSPSGHSNAFGILLTLAYMFLAHLVHDRKWKVPWWIYKMVYPVFGFCIVSVMLARMYVAAHFPHQCLLGVLTGVFIAPAMCIYVCDPFLWRYGIHVNYPVAKAVKWHIFCAVMTAVIAAFTYLAMKINKTDPFGTVKMAFRWCESPESIHVSTTPMFALVQSSGYLLGWAVSVTPAITEYRHDTKNRSILISLFTTLFIIYVYQLINDNLCKSNTFNFYLSQFLMFSLKPVLYLRVVPYLSMWPYAKKIKIA